MARRKTTYPTPSRQTGQRSLDPLFLNRIVPQWRNPDWLSGEAWRRVVEAQPVAVVCRDTLISNIVNLEWAIEPTDSTQRDELKSEIAYYEDLLNFSGELDYVSLVEWLGRDYLDLPMGGVAEVIREGDSPEGRTSYIIPVDAATCFPTDNVDFPIGQTNGREYVYFPWYAINRIYMSPKTSWNRWGWGCAPPEKIFLTITLLDRGDVYYANLFLDSPQVGILDLMDMEKSSAEAWVDSWKNMLSGIDPFKIPVLYEHTSDAKFISFTRSPGELMFDKGLARYVTLLTAGYGMSPSDIGFPSTSGGGETLAGTIRQERRTRRTGYALFKKKLALFFNRLLPPTLRFHFIDLDDELNVAIGRARLATATAMEIDIRNGIITPNEARQQMIADGLFTISMSEAIEGGDEVRQQPMGGNVGSNLLGRPVAPSQGGFGEQRSEVEKSLLEEELLIEDELDDSATLYDNLSESETNFDEENK